MLPENYPSDYIEEVTLKDGSKVLLRPIRPDDAPRLQHAFLHLSPQSIYLRFLESARELTDVQAYAFANLDYQERMANEAARLTCQEKHPFSWHISPG